MTLPFTRRAIAVFLFALAVQAPASAQRSTQASWRWRDSAGVERSRADLDSILAGHARWLSDSSAPRSAQAVLRGADLAGAELAGVNLERVNAGGAQLVGANLSRAILRRATFDEADLRRSNLSGADLEAADLDLARLEGSDLRGAVLRFAKMGAARIDEARLQGADLIGARGLQESFFATGLYFDAQTKWPVGYEPPRNLSATSARIFVAAGHALEQWGGGVITLLVVVLIAGSISSAIAESKKINKQQRKVEVLEQTQPESPQPVALNEFVQRELTVAIERERLNMLRADGRASRLFSLGTGLVVLAVTAPAVGLWIYLRDDPMSQLLDAAARGAVLSTLQGVEVVRDWHVLLAGVTAGFLFLAAAAGLLRQSRHQTTTYFRLARRVSYYEGMISASKIVSRIGPDVDPVVVAHVRTVVAALMALPPLLDDGREKGEPEADGGAVQQIVNALGQLPRT